MPEGPEIASVKKSLESFLVGRRLGELWQSGLKLRRPFESELYEKVKDLPIHSLECFGKVLWIDFGDAFVMSFRLGMSGRLVVVSESEEVVKHTHFRLPILSYGKELRYIDPRRFGEVRMLSKDALKTDVLEQLGPDPFSWTEEERRMTVEKIKKSARAIKNILLDQKILSGVGNIYACEALFMAKIHPSCPGQKLSRPRLLRLLTEVTHVMKLGLQNGGTTFRSYVNGAGEKGGNLAALLVFQREEELCKDCNAPIKKMIHSGRATFFCNHCQKF